MTITIIEKELTLALHTLIEQYAEDVNSPGAWAAINFEDEDSVKVRRQKISNAQNMASLIKATREIRSIAEEETKGKGGISEGVVKKTEDVIDRGKQLLQEAQSRTH